LLRGAPFRKAFDRSTEGLPAALAGMLIPLRAVHPLLASHDGRKRAPRSAKGADPARLREGALLLMRVSPKSLLGLDEPVRHRLLQLVTDLSGGEVDVPAEALLALFRSLRFAGAREREDALVGLVGLLLRAGLEPEARALLGQETGRASELLALLREPRVGTIALEPRPGRPQAPRDRGKSSASLPPSGRWYSGVHLPSMQRVRVAWGEPGDRARFAAELEVWNAALVPQVALPVAFDATESAPRPYWAVAHLDSSFVKRLERVDALECRAHALDLCRIENALSALGVRLPDGELGRFAVDASGRLWLADLSGATRVAAGGEPAPSWLPAAVRELARRAAGLSLSDAELENLDGCGSALDVAARLGLVADSR
jgi:hypothetical protein